MRMTRDVGVTVTATATDTAGVEVAEVGAEALEEIRAVDMAVAGTDMDQGVMMLGEGAVTVPEVVAERIGEDTAGMTDMEATVMETTAIEGARICSTTTFSC